MFFERFAQESHFRFFDTNQKIFGKTLQTLGLRYGRMMIMMMMMMITMMMYTARITSYEENIIDCSLRPMKQGRGTSRKDDGLLIMRQVTRSNYGCLFQKNMRGMPMFNDKIQYVVYKRGSCLDSFQNKNKSYEKGTKIFITCNLHNKM
jgi:hypothetical protein